MNPIKKGMITKLTKFLISKGCEVEDVANTGSTYIKCGHCPIRISDHIGLHSAYINIIIPYNRNSYVIIVNRNIFHFDNLREVKEFLSGFVDIQLTANLDSTSVQSYKEEVVRLNASMQDKINIIKSLKAELEIIKKVFPNVN